MNRYAIKPGRSRHKPLRSFNEMADEFGVSCKTLAAYGRQHTLPTPKLSFRGAAGSTAKWYDPDEMRAWWKQVQERRSA